MTPRRCLDQRLRLPLLQAVDAIERHRSLLKASVAFGASQPALTRSLHELEDMLQLRLFDRHSRGVRPTGAGAVFVRSARHILAELRRLDEDLDLLSSPGGVALGALPVAAAGVLPGALAFGREALWTEPLSVLARAGHPLFAARVSLDALRRCDLALPTITQRVGGEIEHLLSRLGIDPAAALRSSSYDLIREMLHGTDLLSVMPRLMMVGDLLRVVPLPVSAPDRPAGLILPRGGALPPAALAFVECLRAHVAELAGRGVAPAITRGGGAAGKSDTTRPGTRGQSSEATISAGPGDGRRREGLPDARRNHARPALLVCRPGHRRGSKPRRVAPARPPRGNRWRAAWTSRLSSTTGRSRRSNGSWWPCASWWSWPTAWTWPSWAS